MDVPPFCPSLPALGKELSYPQTRTVADNTVSDGIDHVGGCEGQTMVFLVTPGFTQG